MGEALTTAVSTSFQTVATDTIALFATILPIGLGVFTAMWAIKAAKKFFKGVGA